jgi:hypothetical protein
MTKYRRFFPIIWICVFLVSTAASSSEANPVFKHKQSRAFSESAATAPGKTLYIDTYSTDLTITASDENAVTVEAVVEVSDEDEEVVKYFLAETQLFLEPYADGLRLRLSSPMDQLRKPGKPPKEGIFRRFYKGNKFVFQLSYSARLTIRIPARHNLKVENAYGNILIGGVEGDLHVANRSGKVRLDRCGGELELRNSYDLVEIPGFKGPVNIKNPSGEVEVRDAEGDVHVENSYAPVRFDTIGGSLTISSKSGKVTGSNVKGDCEITSSYEEIDIRGVEGRLTIKGPSCKVTAQDITLDAHIENSYSPVSVAQVGGILKVKSGSSAVTADDIGGNASIRSSYDAIVLSNVRGSAEVESPSSSVSVREVDGNVTIVSSYNNVIVAGVGGWLDVRSQSAGVKASDIKKNASIVTSYDRVEVSGVGENLKIDASSSSIQAEDISGDVSAKNSYGSVVLRRTSGSIEVHGSRIDVAQIENLPKNSRIELVTTYDPVILTLPEGADVVISVLSGGRISSTFPVYHVKSQAQKLEAVLTKGGATVYIETNGNINIKSSRITIKEK